MQTIVSVRQPNLRKKIAELFDSRRLWDWLLLRGATKPMIRSIESHLVAVQETIYRLDKYGESHWAIENTKINGIWHDIHGAISDADTKMLARPHVIRSLNELRSYQDIEIALRFGIDPLAVDISNFYYLKSCDLRLCRTLATEHLGLKSPRLAEFQLWRVHDICGEIKDDLDDLEEDTSTFNCNRFLISILKRGASYTGQEYCGVLQRCFRSLRGIISNIDDADEQSCAAAYMTKQALSETEDVLRRRLYETTASSALTTVTLRAKGISGAACATPTMAEKISSHERL